MPCLRQARKVTCRFEHTTNRELKKIYINIITPMLNRLEEF